MTVGLCGGGEQNPKLLGADCGVQRPQHVGTGARRAGLRRERALIFPPWAGLQRESSGRRKLFLGPGWAFVPKPVPGRPLLAQTSPSPDGQGGCGWPGGRPPTWKGAVFSQKWSPMERK